jgi:hypothetical protein
MSSVFADTFYWIAFTNVQHMAHERQRLTLYRPSPQKFGRRKKC